MLHKTVKACQQCGAPFYGERDYHYCPKCAKEKKLDTVVKIRTCQDCGMEFYGGPRARRCPNCAYEAQRETNRRHKQAGTMRPIGSTDKCAVCGSDYIVKSGRQKYCSDKCQREGILAWQREHKKGYEKATGQNAKKQDRRKNQQKICVYCAKPFRSSNATNLCSEYCRAEYAKIQMCKADIKRGRKRDLQKYIDAMMAYREQVKTGIDGPGE